MFRNVAHTHTHAHILGVKLTTATSSEPPEQHVPHTMFGNFMADYVEFGRSLLPACNAYMLSKCATFQ